MSEGLRALLRIRFTQISPKTTIISPEGSFTNSETLMFTSFRSLTFGVVIFLALPYPGTTLTMRIRMQSLRNKSTDKSGYQY